MNEKTSRKEKKIEISEAIKKVKSSERVGLSLDEHVLKCCEQPKEFTRGFLQFLRQYFEDKIFLLVSLGETTRAGETFCNIVNNSGSPRSLARVLKRERAKDLATQIAKDSEQLDLFLEKYVLNYCKKIEEYYTYFKEEITYLILQTDEEAVGILLYRIANNLEGREGLITIFEKHERTKLLSGRGVERRNISQEVKIQFRLRKLWAEFPRLKEKLIAREEVLEDIREKVIFGLGIVAKLESSPFFSRYPIEAKFVLGRFMMKISPILSSGLVGVSAMEDMENFFEEINLVLGSTDD
ncbi:MAG TPA: hypothetical protein ENI70_01920 [Candidatus Peregrinibacteria bacterium]|nr:hypothetical protein [Candidatus Peregrinibacteria bacterium]